MRTQRKEIAQETLKIQQQGFYTLNNRQIDISALQRHSEEASRLISPDEGKKLINALTANNAIKASYSIINASTVQVIINEFQPGTSLAALNFASAKNPGGGFLNGAMAQEEAIAVSSGLYSTQLQNRAYYENNRACGTMMYTDHAIYSPDVVFFRDASYNLLETPVTASILTLPAVNMGQVRAKGEDINQAKVVMKNRMRLALAILAHEKNEIILLGAYGCGVFGNDPNEVALWWRELLKDEGYGCYFKRVLFVVLDHQEGKNIKAFERIWGSAY